MGLIVTFLLGVFVLFGALIAGVAKNGNRISEISIAIALGAMAALLAQDLFPEALEIAHHDGWLLVIGAALAGVVILVVLDKFLPESHHGKDRAAHGDSALHISIAATIALVVHNLVEGMSVYTLTGESLSAAVTLAIGIGLHNVPMGMIVYAGVRDESTTRKVVVLACAALSTFVGGLIMFALNGVVNELVVNAMICMTIGLLLFIICAELVPHIAHSHHKGLAFVFILVGVAAVLVSGVFHDHGGGCGHIHHH